MPRGGKRPGSGRKPVPEPRSPYPVLLTEREHAAIIAEIDPGEAFSEFGRITMLEAAEARRRSRRETLE